MTATGAMRGTFRRASAAAQIVSRLAEAAAAVRPAAWARKGPATAPARVAAASPVRNMALTRPSTASGISRCTVAEEEPSAQAGQQESGLLAAAKALDAERNEQGAQRRVGRQEDDRDRQQRPHRGLTAQRSPSLDHVGGYPRRGLLAPGTELAPVPRGQEHRGGRRHVTEGIRADERPDAGRG